MSTFKEIAGRNIRSYTTNPDNPLEGQMWYNQTELKLKGVTASGAWSSASTSVNGGSSRIGFGIQTAGIAAGGSTAPGNQTVVEEYNGSGWSTETALPVSRQDGGGAGTTTAGLVWCGEGPAKLNTTQEYDGSSWTTTGNYPITARGVRGSGTQTAAIGDGGDTPAPAASNVSAEYNGSTWTAGNNLPGNRIAAATSGTQTSALATTGKDNTPNASVSNLNTSYDGTSWTVETVYPLSLRQAVSTGTSSAANLVAGGVGDAPFGSAVTAANVWNGSSWTAVGDLGTKSTHGNGAGSSTASYINSGAQDYPSYPGVTQEYNFTANTITPGAWASGGALSTGRESMSSAGTQTAALAVGGRVGPPGGTTAVESYNGTAMSGAPSLNTARQYAGGCGTQTAAITYANNPVSGATEEYDGSSWATQPNSMATARRSFASFGIQTAALAAGGTTGPAVSSLTEEYNGTSWTAGGALSQARQYFAGAGIETSGLVFGGSDNPNSTKYTNTEEYGGSSWTAGGALLTGTSGLMGCGATQTAALAFGGYQPSKVATTVGYDGTAWSTRPSMGGATAEGSGAGTNVAALSIGGSPAETGVEEFTGETTSVNILDITTS